MSALRPKDMTAEQLEALPVGPFIRHSRPILPAERGRYPHGRTVEWFEAPPMLCGPLGEDDIFAWQDSDGRVWDFGQWADGRWFKQPSVLP